MSAEEGAILYIASRLPALSETFVWREVLTLRGRGEHVLTASVRAPEGAAGDEALEAMARDSVGVYGPGGVRLGLDALREVASKPGRSLGTLGRAVTDAVRAQDHRGRVKIIVQGMAALALAHRLRGFRIRHVHAHMAHVPTTIAMYLARQLGVGFSFTGHANDLFHERALLREKLTRCSFVACISRWHRRFYQGIAAIPDERAPVIRCGVEMAEPAVPADRSDWRIISVGRFVEKKGFDTLIEAIASLPREVGGKRVALTIIGDGPMREKLESLRAQLGCDDRVSLPGAMPNREVQQQLRSADLFALACRTDSVGDRDGIPVVLMEAMASGICVVAGGLETIQELVEDGATGVLLPPEASPAEYTAAILRLLEDDAGRGRLAAAGRDWVEEEFSAIVNAERLIDAFSKVEQGALP